MPLHHANTSAHACAQPLTAVDSAECEPSEVGSISRAVVDTLAFADADGPAPLRGASEAETAATDDEPLFALFFEEEIAQLMSAGLLRREASHR